MIYDVIIVGAGVCGITAARKLVDAGRSVLVLEKSRGLGGRMATKRGDDETRFDHGAQYFTIRSPEVSRLLDPFKESGLLRPWTDHFAGSRNEHRETRWIVNDGMSRLARAIAEHHLRPVLIKNNHTVKAISKSDQGSWVVTCDTPAQLCFESKSVLITAPPPQAAALLSAVEEVEAEKRTLLSKLEFLPCIAILTTTSSPSSIPNPGGVWPGENSCFSWIADQQQKGISKSPAQVFHVNDALSQIYLEKPEAVLEAVGEEIKSWIGPHNHILQTVVHRWRYARPSPDNQRDALSLYIELDRQRSLLAAGDAFSGGRVEGAMLSGIAASKALTKST